MKQTSFDGAVHIDESELCIIAKKKRKSQSKRGLSACIYSDNYDEALDLGIEGRKGVTAPLHLSAERRVNRNVLPSMTDLSER